MNEFDFLKQHGYGVVYGADAVRAKINSLGHNKNKEKQMTDFDIKETVVQTGYVNKDGKFVPETDPTKVEQINSGPVFVQSSEDSVE